MNFRRRRHTEEPEINLVAMIDVLLVILIFLMVSTTYSKFSGLEINLPAAAEMTQAKDQLDQINVVIATNGDVAINNAYFGNQDVAQLAEAFARLPSAADAKKPIVIISAHAKTSHQRVVDVMQAAKQAGLAHVSFVTQQGQR
jgi:biopolymer transport protein ExbD